MARAPRRDTAGAWHHVLSRGIARRSVFEDAVDVRYFLSRLARAVRAGRIEVHAYCVMTTHFHLLVRSPNGVLADAMQRVLNDYVRWFNRGRKRDGSLFRSRYTSRVVETLEYRRLLVQYIDDNPVLARLVATPALYPHGSARRYFETRGPPWLDRSWVEGEVRVASRSRVYDPASYARCFGTVCPPGLARIVERRIATASHGGDPLDDLLGAAPDRVLDWMRRKAALADGTRIDLPVCDVADVIRIVRAQPGYGEDWRIALSRVASNGWRLVEVALLRDLCALTWAEIGAEFHVSERAALRTYRLHVRALAEVPEYAATSSRVATAAVRSCYGSRASLGGGSASSDAPSVVSSLLASG